MLMMTFGLLVAANTTANTGLRSSSPTAELLVAVSLLSFGVLPAAAIHVIFAFPSGRLAERLDRWFVVAAYMYGVLDGVRILLTLVYGNDSDVPWVQSLIRVRTDLGGEGMLGGVAVAGWLVFATGFVVLLLRRVMRATTRERRILVFPLTAVAAITAMFVLREGWLVGRAIGTWTGTVPPWLRPVMTVVVTVAVPVAFLVGLLMERLAYASLGDLVRAFDGLPAGQVQPALARALGDPSLQLLFPVAGGYVDEQGRPAEAPPKSFGRSVTPLGDGGAPVAVLVHDSALVEEAELLQTAASATKLALDNARLHAEVKAQLAEVYASRARLVAAGDAVRRRLERDLHDGAQQRLLTARLTLQILSQRLPNLDPDRQQLLAEAETELRKSYEELRELARGIHPAILTDLGLRAASTSWPCAFRCRLSLPATPLACLRRWNPPHTSWSTRRWPTCSSTPTPAVSPSTLATATAGSS